MTHWIYLATTATINNSLLNKELSLSIIVVLSSNFLNTFIKISLFWVNFINITVVTPNWNSIGWNVYVSTVFLLSTVLVTKNLAISISVGFPKNSQIVACCTFGRFRFRTLTRSIFKNQTNGTFKPLGYNWNHQGFLKKIVTLHHCGFNLKFPKYLSWRLLFWVNTIGEIIVTEN